MTKRVPVIQFGFGGVGRTLVRQVMETREHVAARTGLELRHVAIVEGEGFVARPEGLDDDVLRAALALPRGDVRLSAVPGRRERPGDDRAVIEWLHGQGVRGAVVVDVTAAVGGEGALIRATELGYGVTMSNKRPLVAAYADFRRLKDSRRVLHETTVAAGVPVIYTLDYLLDTGDRVTAIEGCFSGTLGYLCSQLEDEVPFSAAVAEAKRLGYTEPNPREDLCGLDVARKALILARCLGWPLELDDVEVESLYPPEMETMPVPEFMAALPALDHEYALRSARARQAGDTLRYVAEVRDGKCRVGLRQVPQGGQIGRLRGTDNIVTIHTERYGDAPLVLIGAGAGLEVTAAGVFNDVLRLAREG